MGSIRYVFHRVQVQGCNKSTWMGLGSKETGKKTKIKTCQNLRKSMHLPQLS